MAASETLPGRPASSPARDDGPRKPSGGPYGPRSAAWPEPDSFPPPSQAWPEPDPWPEPGRELFRQQRERAEGIGQIGRRRRREVIRRQLGIGSDAEQAEADADLVLEQFKRAHQSRHARRAEAEAGEPADAGRFRAERDRFHHVAAAHVAAVDPDLGFSFDRLDD